MGSGAAEKMTRVTTIVILFLLGAAGPSEQEVRYFPSILYGQILVGPGASRYETIFTITARTRIPVSVELFTDKGEPMEASFVDQHGEIATTASSFRFFLNGEQPLQIKLQPSADESGQDVFIRTGWATFRSAGDIEVWALVRVLTPEGKLIEKHVLAAEKPSIG